MIAFKQKPFRTARIIPLSRHRKTNSGDNRRVLFDLLLIHPVRLEKDKVMFS